MQLLDFNGVAYGTVVLDMHKQELSEELIRHMVLNSIRMYNKKFRAQYGQMIICCEGGQTWRKEDFPQYKANRKKGREESTTDWEAVFKILDNIKEDLKNNFPYKVLQVKGAEADDIIGVLATRTQEFGLHEEVIIISSDKDFIQLHKNNNVRQFSPRTKKFVQEKNPRLYTAEHIFKGDGSDGVPNVLSPDNHFLLEGVRQKPVTKKKIAEWLENIDNLENVMDEETYRNYCRNKRMIDLDEIPASLQTQIINSYEEAKPASKLKVLNYLIKKRCRNLIECVGDFH